ncbi:hypothetical protein [Saccharibacillus kuerlensis]|uniref:YecA family protein n=1 Tax=Saccharibacillus kuerlensis TaxID=459527 RepID=A0ABQ2KS03_9BACL|nr:hypothetical protein [Saccharibacillus kuerlensis]GGN90980.1 hypothetical protein GCM10010969_01980 [Saccharibacillus kuerlensis]
MNLQEWVNAALRADIGEEEVQQALWALSNTPLLYDDGKTIAVEDYMKGLESQPSAGEQEALDELFGTAVLLCRRYAEPADYDRMQDVLSLQFDLWARGVLRLEDWMAWLLGATEGSVELPAYDFDEVLGSAPEDFMIQDFHDELNFRLEDAPEDEWALSHLDELYRRVGVTGKA